MLLTQAVALKKVMQVGNDRISTFSDRHSFINEVVDLLGIGGTRYSKQTTLPRGLKKYRPRLVGVGWIVHLK